MNLTIEILKAQLLKNKMAQIKISSDSMKPLLLPGDILTVTPLDKPLERFDIIVFNYFGHPFCHFFWGKPSGQAIDSEQIFTRSLKNPSQVDIPILHKDILGVVTYKKINFFHKLKVYFSIALQI